MSETRNILMDRGLKKKILFKGMATFLALAGALLGGEILVRLIPSKVPSPSSLPWKQYDGFYTYEVNTNFTIPNERGIPIRIFTDKYGLRTHKTLSRDGMSILVLGDSFVEAANTMEEDAFCSRLEALLPGGQVACINGGIGGYSNYQSLLLLRHLYNSLKPQIVVLMVYLGNDLRDNYWAVMEKEASGKTAEVGCFCSGIFRRLAARSRLYSWGKSAFRCVETHEERPFEDYFKSEIYTYETQPKEWVVESVGKTHQIVKMLSEFCSARGVKFVVFGIPSKAQVEREFRQIGHFERSPANKDFALDVMKNPEGYSFDKPSEYYEDACRKLGISYHSLLAVFRENQTKELYGDVDVHWNANGQGLAAAFVADYLGKSGVFGAQPTPQGGKSKVERLNRSGGS